MDGPRKPSSSQTLNQQIVKGMDVTVLVQKEAEFKMHLQLTPVEGTLKLGVDLIKPMAEGPIEPNLVDVIKNRQTVIDTTSSKAKISNMNTDYNFDRLSAPTRTSVKVPHERKEEAESLPKAIGGDGVVPASVFESDYLSRQVNKGASKQQEVDRNLSLGGYLPNQSYDASHSQTNRTDQSAQSHSLEEEYQTARSHIPAAERIFDHEDKMDILEPRVTDTKMNKEETKLTKLIPEKSPTGVHANDNTSASTVLAEKELFSSVTSLDYEKSQIDSEIMSEEDAPEIDTLKTKKAFSSIQSTIYTDQSLEDLDTPEKSESKLLFQEINSKNDTIKKELNITEQTTSLPEEATKLSSPNELVKQPKIALDSDSEYTVDIPVTPKTSTSLKDTLHTTESASRLNRESYNKEIDKIHKIYRKDEQLEKVSESITKIDIETKKSSGLKEEYKQSGSSISANGSDVEIRSQTQALEEGSPKRVQPKTPERDMASSSKQEKEKDNLTAVLAVTIQTGSPTKEKSTKIFEEVAVVEEPVIELSTELKTNGTNLEVPGEESALEQPSVKIMSHFKEEDLKDNAQPALARKIIADMNVPSETLAQSEENHRKSLPEKSEHDVGKKIEGKNSSTSHYVSIINPSEEIHQEINRSDDPATNSTQNYDEQDLVTNQREKKASLKISPLSPKQNKELHEASLSQKKIIDDSVEKPADVNEPDNKTRAKEGKESDKELSKDKPQNLLATSPIKEEHEKDRNLQNQIFSESNLVNGELDVAPKQEEEFAFSGETKPGSVKKSADENEPDSKTRAMEGKEIGKDASGRIISAEGTDKKSPVGKVNHSITTTPHRTEKNEAEVALQAIELSEDKPQRVLATSPIKEEQAKDSNVQSQIFSASDLVNGELDVAPKQEEEFVLSGEIQPGKIPTNIDPTGIASAAAQEYAPTEAKSDTQKRSNSIDFAFQALSESDESQPTLQNVALEEDPVQSIEKLPVLSAKNKALKVQEEVTTANTITKIETKDNTLVNALEIQKSYVSESEEHSGNEKSTPGHHSQLIPLDANVEVDSNEIFPEQCTKVEPLLISEILEPEEMPILTLAAGSASYVAESDMKIPEAVLIEDRLNQEKPVTVESITDTYESSSETIDPKRVLKDDANIENSQFAQSEAPKLIINSSSPSDLQQSSIAVSDGALSTVETGRIHEELPIATTEIDTKIAPSEVRHSAPLQTHLSELKQKIAVPEEDGGEAQDINSDFQENTDEGALDTKQYRQQNSLPLLLPQVDGGVIQDIHVESLENTGEEVSVNRQLEQQVSLSSKETSATQDIAEVCLKCTEEENLATDPCQRDPVWNPILWMLLTLLQVVLYVKLAIYLYFMTCIFYAKQIYLYCLTMIHIAMHISEERQQEKPNVKMLFILAIAWFLTGLYIKYLVSTFDYIYAPLIYCYMEMITKYF